MRSLGKTAFATLLLVGMALGASGYTLTGNSWGEGATVTFSFDKTSQGYTVDETAYGGGVTTSERLKDVFPKKWEDDITAAFDTWAAAANVSFDEITDSQHDFDAAGAEAQIRIAAHIFDGPGGEYSHAYEPPPLGVTAAGDMHFDSEEDWHAGTDPPGPGQYDTYSVALHEIGHAIGLQDSADGTSVMYSDYWCNGARTLSADDIAGAIAVYGADTSPTPEPETWAAAILLFAAILIFRRGVNRSEVRSAGL